MKSLYPFIFFFGLFSLTPFFVLAQCSFNANYSAILYAEAYKKPNGDKVLIKRVAEVDEAFCFSEAVNEMPDFFSYLKTHFTEPQAYQEIDLTLMKQNASLQESLAKYYRAKAISLPFQIIEFE